MSLRSPLGRILGLGSAGRGTEDWWLQRVTAVALVPLSLWLAASLLGMDSFDHASVQAWIGRPLNAVLLAGLLISGLWHSHLGVRVVVEDYVHTGWIKVTTLVVLQLAHAALGVAALYSIIVISLRTAA